MPAPVDEVHVLALLTRVRQARIDTGEIKTPQGLPGQTPRLYDIRAFKCAFAELGYLRRLGPAGRSGGTIATSMTQLVAGLAPLHPAWKMEGDKFADRDRHHRAVRRRLRDLQDMGLLCWQPGLDVDGEEARTEIQLLTAADVSVDELADAAAKLRAWKGRYGRALNTGSSTGICSAGRHGRPLSATERQRRGIARSRDRARSRREPSTTNSDPHFVAPPTSENTPSHDSRPVNDGLCGLRTGVTREHVTGHADLCAARTESTTASPKIGGLDPAVMAGLEATRTARLERFEAVRAARQPVFDLIASQSAKRSAEVAAWSVDRGLPMNRVREAWAVWRYGPMHVAEHSWGAAAGRLEPDDAERLRRAGARYERHAAACPTGYPPLALGALEQIARTAAARDARPLTLHYGIRALDQLSRRMRASATTDDPRRRDRQAKRARKRVEQRAVVTPDMEAIGALWLASRWPLWVTLNDAGEPILVDGELVLNTSTGTAPNRSDCEYLDMLRDAYLLAGLWPRAERDGRSTMARDDDRAPAAGDQSVRRRARRGPYGLPIDWREEPEPDDLELARLHPWMSLRDVQRLAVEERDRRLEEHRALARDAAAERDGAWRRIREGLTRLPAPEDEEGQRDA